MGAWGVGSFENDAAMDWTYDVHSPSDVSKPFERLKRETDVHPDQGEMHLDADFASELVAAAECVAMMMGREIPGFPDELKQVLAGAPEPDALLFHQARNALMSVTRHSELAELWEEASEGEETNPWLLEVSELVDRLNPDVEFNPRTAPDLINEDQEEGGPICGFCRKAVAAEEFFGMTITDYTDRWAFERVMPIHVKCLNTRLHHDTMIFAMKDDPDRPIDLDKL